MCTIPFFEKISPTKGSSRALEMNPFFQQISL